MKCRGRLSLLGCLTGAATVGYGYGDRYITTAGAQTVVLPDERTSRWMVLHVHCYTNLGCTAAGEAVIATIAGVR